MSARIERMEPASFACSNKLGSVGGSRAYPVTLASSAFSHNNSQLPLKPVCPVTKTLRPSQNERLIMDDPCPRSYEPGASTERRNARHMVKFLENERLSS